MSDKMGPLTYGSKDEQVFLGKDMSSQKNFSDQTAKLIDQEVKMLVMDGHTRATDLLTKNRDILEKMAQTLLERETLDGQNIKDIIAGKDISDDEDSGSAQIIKPDNLPLDKNKSESNTEEGLMGGGMPDPTPA
jgi:cell division protease FtsH